MKRLLSEITFEEMFESYQNGELEVSMEFYSDKTLRCVFISLGNDDYRLWFWEVDNNEVYQYGNDTWGTIGNLDFQIRKDDEDEPQTFALYGLKTERFKNDKGEVEEYLGVDMSKELSFQEGVGLSTGNLGILTREFSRDHEMSAVEAVGGWKNY